MFVAIDLETTGVDPKKDKIIEFGAIKFDLGGEKETLRFLVNPGITLPQIITHITNITDKDLADAPKFEEKAQEIREFIGDLPIIGHNTQFDTSFLKENNINIPNPEYDTLQFAGILFPSLPSYSLEILTKLLNLRHKEKHRALDDAIATMELFMKLAEKFQKLDTDLIEKIHSLCNKTNWPLKNFLLTLNPAKQKKETSKKITKKPKDPIHNKNYSQFYEQILNTKKSALFEIPPPYEGLVKAISEEVAKDSYISVPHQLFQNLFENISDKIAKIDSPKRYLSPKRLAEFEQNNFFEDYEFTALLKYLVWHKITETGLLSEITLFQQEKTTIFKINIDENFTDIKTEPFFQKALLQDKDSPAFCSHQYIAEHVQPTFKDLIIIDFDRFTKTLYNHASTYLKLDIFLYPLFSLKSLYQENKTIESLISKSTILFGLIGMIFEKYNDKSPYVPRTIISNVDFGLKEWMDAKNSIQNLIIISKDLKEIHTPKTNGYLQKWKDSLKTLEDIFNSPDLENYMTWIEKDPFGNIIIRKAPYSLKPQIKQILDSCKNYKIISENLDMADDAEFIKKLFGLPEELPLNKSITKKESLNIYVPSDIVSEENYILSKILEKKGHTAIIFNSKQQMQYFTLKLSQPLSQAGVKIVSQMTGSLGKLTEQFKQNPDNSVIFLTPNFWENFLDHESIDTLIIHKIPFDPPSDPFIMTMSKHFNNAFMEFQIPSAVFSLKTMINRLCIDEKKSKDLIILDPRLTSKDYGKHFLDVLGQMGEIVG